MHVRLPDTKTGHFTALIKANNCPKHLGSWIEAPPFFCPAPNGGPEPTKIGIYKEDGKEYDVFFQRWPGYFSEISIPDHDFHYETPNNMPSFADLDTYFGPLHWLWQFSENLWDFWMFVKNCLLRLGLV